MKSLPSFKYFTIFIWCIATVYSVAQNTIYRDKIFQDTISPANFLIINRWTKDKVFSYKNYPYVSKESNEGWALEVVDEYKWLVRFKHEASGLYMKSYLDSMYLGSLDKKADEALWRIEKYNDYYRIAHVLSGLYLNTETKKLSLSKTLPGWFSGHWRLERKAVYFNTAEIINRWTNHKLQLSEIWTGDSLVNLEYWVVENLYDLNATVHLKHLATGKYLKSFQDSLYAGNLDKAQADAQWIIERYGDYYRIKHEPTGHYLNTETGRLSVSDAVPTWFSNQWKFELKKK
ncbi:MAG: hypothetical protein ABI761_00140 [Saprospiraceae bacterium]